MGHKLAPDGLLEFYMELVKPPKGKGSKNRHKEKTVVITTEEAINTYGEEFIN